MTHRSPHAAVLLLCAALALPGTVDAASLSLLDASGSGSGAPALDMVPDLPGDPLAQPLSPEPSLPGTAPFKFVDDTGLNADPMRGVLPDNQWANPQAAQTGPIQRR